MHTPPECRTQFSLGEWAGCGYKQCTELVNTSVDSVNVNLDCFVLNSSIKKLNIWG